jgi:hypothetical protein
MTEHEREIEELAVQLADMLGAALYFAGVKKDRIKEAMDTYIEEIDNFFKDDDGQMGMDEMIALIKHLKKSKPQLFS